MANKSPSLSKSVVIQTVEMHTGGQPMRIVVGGYPQILGKTILDKRRYVKEKYDHLRKMLVLEPRGSNAMCGVLIVEKDIPETDMAVLFMHGEGYSTMCGDAVISLGRYAIDYGLVPPISPCTTLTIQCPCGPVKVNVQYENGQSGGVSFHSVPSFVESLNQTVQVTNVGLVAYDLVFGGAYYAFVDARSVGIDLVKTPIHQCVEVAGSITDELRRTITITHPQSPDMGFLSGTILTTVEEKHTKLVCFYAERQVDRSPCGSGVTAKTVLEFFKEKIHLGEEQSFVNGKVGSEFVASPLREEEWYGKRSLIVKVKGNSYYLGENKYWLEENDQLGEGFLVK